MAPMAFMTAAPLVRGAGATRAAVTPRRLSALPARAARRAPSAANVSMVGGSLNDLLSNNLEWSKHMTSDDPDYFKDLVAMQQPDYLWIGCTFFFGRGASLLLDEIVVGLAAASARSCFWPRDTSLTRLGCLILVAVASCFQSQAPTRVCRPTSSSACRRVPSLCTATLPTLSPTRYVPPSALFASLITLLVAPPSTMFIVWDPFSSSFQRY